MIPKIIHLCWFSNDPYPVEIRECLDTWSKVLPDYQVRIWREADARAIGIPFINDALDARRWAFAADAVRFYAVYTEGGVYMDSDIYLLKRFDHLLPAGGEMVTFHEKIHPDEKGYGLQAAFFMAGKGNEFCRRVLERYRTAQYRNADGTCNEYISPMVMRDLARDLGYVENDELQRLPGLTIYPTHLLAPAKTYPRDAATFGIHRIYGSWRKRKFGRRIELWFKHLGKLIAYNLRRH